MPLSPARRGTSDAARAELRRKRSNRALGIVDLRDPANPKEVGNWREVAGGDTTSTHDVTEIAPGIVVTSTEPLLLLDARKDPANPTRLQTGRTPGFAKHATAL